MKFKAFFIYIAVGAAFLAASLWVILSGGKNAKAIRTKYKLGGALLTAWAMLSAGTCNGPVPTVTCYDPIPPEQPLCYDVAVPINKVTLESTTVKRGEKVKFTIDEPYAERFEATITGGEDKQLQKAELQKVEGSELEFFFVAGKDLPAGKAVLSVEAIIKDSEGQETADVVFTAEITIE